MEDIDNILELFLDGESYSILMLTPSLCSLSLIPHRLISSLTLFKLGRVDTCIRELALTVELATDEKDRLILCKYLQKVVEFRNDGENVHGGYIPIHSQAEKYSLCNGKLDDYSLSKLCSTTKELCDTVVKDLVSFQGIASSKLKHKKVPKGILNKLFTSIKYYSPIYVYDEVIANKSLIDMYLTEEISTYPEIDYINCGTKTILEMVSRVISNERSISASLSLSGLVVKHQVIRGFMAMISDDIDLATEVFLWLSKFFEESSMELFDRDEYLSSVTQKLVSVFLGICLLMKPSTVLPNVSTSSILVNIVEVSDKMNLISEYLTGRLFQYFVVCGGLYERMALEESTKIKINDDDATALRLCPNSLDDMIRKYIIATTIAAIDDQSVIGIYQRILWGLLMYGGIHLETFWFFKFVKDVIFLKLEFGPIQGPPPAKTKKKQAFAFNPYNIGDVFLFYTNGTEAVESITMLKKTIVKEVSARGGGGDSNEDSYLLIPQVFHYQNQLIFSDKYYDEVVHAVTERDYVSVSPSKIAPKRRVHIKLGNERVLEQIEISRLYATLWLESFHQYHGHIPEEIKLYWNSTAIGAEWEIE